MVQLDIEGAAFERPIASGWPFGDLPRNHFQAIVADPPWRFASWSDKGEGKSASQHYDVMTLDDIKALPVGDLSAPDCMLFMWVVDPMLPHAFEVLDAWGFTYKTKAFTWAKTTRKSSLSWLPKWHFGMGYYTRGNPEDCLLATRGKPKRIGRGVRQLIVSPVREHSRKPDEALERVEQLVAGPYVELFSRTARPGWASWGNQTGLFSQDTPS